MFLARRVKDFIKGFSPLLTLLSVPWFLIAKFSKLA